MNIADRSWWVTGSKSVRYTAGFDVAHISHFVLLFHYPFCIYGSDVWCPRSSLVHGHSGAVEFPPRRRVRGSISGIYMWVLSRTSSFLVTLMRLFLQALLSSARLYPVWLPGRCFPLKMSIFNVGGVVIAWLHETTLTLFLYMTQTRKQWKQ